MGWLLSGEVVGTAGGFGGYIRAGADWLTPLPEGLSLRESMILGTAGFTAALALLRMQENRQHPELGPIAVTGAEVVSATATVGLSTGIARPALEPLLKLVLCFDMLAGRVEIFALLVVLYPGTWFGKRAEAA